MTDQTFDKWEYLCELLSQHYVRLGGEMFEQCLSAQQLEHLKTIDPAAARAQGFMESMLSGLQRDDLLYKKALAVGELVLELRERQKAEKDADYG